MRLAISKLNLVGFLLLVLVRVVAAQEEPPAPWARFEPEGGGFSVLMPGKPVEAIDKRRTFTLHSFTVTMGRGTYVASYSDYIAEVKLNPSTALIRNRDQFNKSFEATLISSREITVDGHTGLEFTSESPAVNLKSQLFLIGNRVYQTATMVFKDVDETRNVDRFFQSFKFSRKDAKTQSEGDRPLALRPGAFAGDFVLTSSSYLITPCSGLDALA